MKLDLTTRAWPTGQSAVFFRSREKHGDLSNMTRGFPLRVNGLEFQGPEGLYQALKFPQNAPLQARIGRERSGMDAKKTAYAHHQDFNADWDSVKLDAMAFTLAIKLLQNPKGSETPSRKPRTNPSSNAPAGTPGGAPCQPETA